MSPFTHSQWRQSSPSIVEAEAADLEVCRQLGESLNEGLTLDQALHECVKGPTLSTLLQLRPKMSKGHEVKDSERLRRPKRARKNTCHKFQIELADAKMKSVSMRTFVSIAKVNMGGRSAPS